MTSEPVYLVCEELDDTTKFVVQRLKRHHDVVEVVTCDKLWRLDTLSGVYILIKDPDEMSEELLEEVVARVNQTYDASRTLVAMVSARYGIS